MLLIKGAELYAPEYKGKKDVLIAGGRIEKIGEELSACNDCQVLLIAMFTLREAAEKAASTHRHRRFSSRA